MNTEDNKPSLNFIEHIIEDDLSSGKHKTIQTRFPPEPNGFLHIGHAKAIVVNFELAKKYNGKCNLRFDDTNPEKEKVDYVDGIKADIKWLGYEWGETLYTSDYFEQLYMWAVQLIKDGKAYIDDQSAEELSANRGTPSEPSRKGKGERMTQQLVKGDQGLAVRSGGVPVDREIGPEHERSIAAALDRNSEAMDRNSALFEVLFRGLNVKDRAKLLGITPRQDLRIRRQRALKDSLKGEGR